jgi:hypothetical protein
LEKGKMIIGVNGLSEDGEGVSGVADLKMQAIVE